MLEWVCPPQGGGDCEGAAVSGRILVVDDDPEILSLLRQGVSEVDALVARIYRDAPERLMRLARHQVLAHLHKLGAEGRVVAEVAGKSFRVV